MDTEAMGLDMSETRSEDEECDAIGEAGRRHARDRGVRKHKYMGDRGMRETESRERHMHERGETCERNIQHRSKGTRQRG